MISLRGIKQPKELRAARGKSIEFFHQIHDTELMIYFTDGTYVIVSHVGGYQDHFKYEYVEEDMGS